MTTPPKKKTAPRKGAKSQEKSAVPTANPEIETSGAKDAKTARTRSEQVLRTEIQQQLSMDPPARPPRLLPKPTDIAVIAAAFAGAKGSEIVQADMSAANSLWEQACDFLASEDAARRRETAVRELLFSKGKKTIDPEFFLKRLLPNDTVEKRKELLNQALERLPSAFAKFFQIAAGGWPSERLASVVAEAPEVCGLHIKAHYLEKIAKGVDMKTACVIAPVVLAWREFISSSKTRGSLSRAGDEGAFKAETPPDSTPPDTPEAAPTDLTVADCEPPSIGSDG